jgi:hypothetical protein
VLLLMLLLVPGRRHDLLGRVAIVRRSPLLVLVLVLVLVLRMQLLLLLLIRLLLLLLL